MQRWTRPLPAEPDRAILSNVWTTSTCYKPREIERIRQGLVHRYRQQRKFLEVLVMGRSLLCLLPEVFNGIVVWRIRRQGLHGAAIAMGCQKRLGRCT